jgi:RecB family endonuclease NucS
MPGRAIRGAMPRPRSQARVSAEWYALFARSLPGRLRGMPTETRLEELLETEPTILGEPLLIIGRHVATSFGKIIDLLAVDADGILHVLELKKDKTLREVVAQVLDYGSWVRNL